MRLWLFWVALLTLAAASHVNIQTRSNEYVASLLYYRYETLKSGLLHKPSSVLASLGEYTGLAPRYVHLMETPIVEPIVGVVTVVMSSPASDAGFDCDTSFYFESDLNPNTTMHLVPGDAASAVLLQDLVAPTTVQITRGWYLDDILVAQGMNLPAGSHPPLRAQTGNKRGLIIFLDHSDKPWSGETTAEGDADARQVADFHWRRSFRQLNMTWTTLGPFRSIHTAAAYAGSQCGSAYSWGTSEARGFAQGLGYDLNQIRSVVAVVDISCWFAGMGAVSGTNILLAAKAVPPTVLSHEFGHNLGWSHANSWAGNPARPFSLPTTYLASSTEYGDPFEIMGSAYTYATESTISPLQRNLAGWYDAYPNWVSRVSPPVALVNSSITVRLTDPDAAQTFDVMTSPEGADLKLGIITNPNTGLQLAVTFEPALGNRVFVKARVGTSLAVLTFPMDPAKSDVTLTGLRLGEEWCSFNLSRPLCVAAVELATEGTLPVMTVRLRYMAADYYHALGFESAPAPVPSSSSCHTNHTRTFSHRIPVAPGGAHGLGPVHEPPSMAVALTGLPPGSSVINLPSGRTRTLSVQLSNPHPGINTVYLQPSPWAPLTYTLDTSPTYNWVDVRPLAGVKLLSNVNWYVSQQLDLPFLFPFFEGTYTRVTVSGNGFLTFDTQATNSYTSSAIPSTVRPSGLIALRWRYMDKSSGGYYYHATPERAIVQYQSVSSGTVTMQAILYPDGTITMQYARLDSTAGVVGIENLAGTKGISVTGSTVGAGRAIAFRPVPPAAALSPTKQVTLAPYETRTVNVLLAAHTLPVGTTSTFNLLVTSSHTLETTRAGPISVLVTASPALSFLTPLVQFMVNQNRENRERLSASRGHFPSSLVLFCLVMFLPITIEAVVSNGPTAAGSLVVSGVVALSPTSLPVTLLSTPVTVPAGQSATLRLFLGAGAAASPGNFTAVVQLVHNDPGPLLVNDTITLRYGVSSGLLPVPTSLSLSLTSAHTSAVSAAVQIMNNSPYGTRLSVGLPLVVPRRYTVARPAFEWTEIVGLSGTQKLLGITSYSSFEVVALPFAGPFPLYGGEYTSVAVSAAGFLTFGADGRGQYNNAPIPSATAPNALIALRWGTYNPATTGAGVYVHATSERLIVEYANYPDYWNATRRHTMQAVLYPSGQVDMRYLQADPATNVAVGIEDEAGVAGLQICRGAGPAAGCPVSGSAVRFVATPPAATLASAAAFDLGPGQAARVEALINGAGLPAGDFVLSMVLTDTLFGTTTIPINVAAAAAPTLVFSPSVALGPIARGTEILFNLALDNQLGTASLTLTGVSCPTAAVTLVSTATVPPGTTGSAQLRLGPQTAVGLQTATVRLAHNDPAPAMGADLALSWEGLPGLAVSPDSLAVSVVAGHPNLKQTAMRVTNASPYPTAVRPTLTLAERRYTLSRPAIHWIEVDGTPNTTAYPAANTYTGSQVVALPFVFPFYDAEYSSVSVSGSGYLTFGADGRGESTNTAIPDPRAPNALIALRWEALQGSADTTSKLLVHADNEHVIVEYLNCPSYWDRTRRYTMQVILTPDGSITMQYLTLPAGDQTGTVGIENPTGTQGIQVCKDSADCPQAGQAIAFVASGWVARLAAGTPEQLDLGPGATATVNLEVNPAGLTAAGVTTLPLRLEDRLTGLTTSVPLVVTAQAGPAFTLPSSSATIPGVVLDMTAGFSIDVHNAASATAPLLVSGFSVAASSPRVAVALQGTPGPRTLAPGEVTTYAFTVSPIPVEGAYWAVVSFVHNDPMPDYGSVNVSWLITGGTTLSALVPAAPLVFVAGRSNATTATLRVANQRPSATILHMTLTSPATLARPSVATTPVGPDFNMAPDSAIEMMLAMAVGPDVPAGVYPYTVSFTASTDGTTKSVSFVVTVVAQPALVLNTPSVNITVPVNTPAPFVITVTNGPSATAPLSVTGIAVRPATFAANLGLLTTIVGLPPGQTASLQLLLAAQPSPAQDQLVEITLLHNDPDVKAAVALRWTAYVPVPVLVLQTAALDRSLLVGQSLVLDIAVANGASATAPLSVTGVEVSPAGAPVTLAAPLLGLPPGQSGVLKVTLGPFAATGTGTAAVRLISNDPAATTATVAVTWRAYVLTPVLVLVTTSADRRLPVGSETVLDIAVANGPAGQAPLSVTGIEVSPAGAPVTLAAPLLGLPPGQSGVLQLRMGPFIAVGMGTAVVRLVSNDPAATNATVTLRWAAFVPAPVLVLITTAIPEQSLTLGTTKILSIQLANGPTGEAPLSVTGIAVSPAGAPVTLAAPLLGLPPGQGGTLQINLGPFAATGTGTAAVRLISNDPAATNATVTVTWRAYTLVPVLVLGTTTVSRTLALGSTATLDIALANGPTGQAPLSVTGIAVSPAGAPVTLAVPLLGLPPGQSGVLQINLGPFATASSGTAAVRLISNDPAATNATVYVTWNAYAPVPVLVLGTTSLTKLLPVGGTVALDIALSNGPSATAPLSVTGIEVSPAGAPVTLAVPLLGLPPGQGGTLQIHLGPFAATGTGTAAVRLISNDPAATQAKVSLSWTVYAEASLYLPSTSMSGVAVTMGGNRDVYILVGDNAGASGPLVITGIVLTPPDASMLLASPCPLILQPGAQTSLQFRIVAGSVEGTFSASARLLHNDPRPPPDSITFSWSVVKPTVTKYPNYSTFTYAAYRTGAMPAVFSFTNDRPYATTINVAITPTVSAEASDDAAIMWAADNAEGVPEAWLTPEPPYVLGPYESVEARMAVDATGVPANTTFAFDMAVRDELTNETVHTVLPPVCLVTAPDMRVATPVVDLGAINQTANLTATLANMPGAPKDLEVAGVYLQGTGLALAPEMGANVTLVLTAGQTAELALQVQPTGINGSHAGTLTFIHNDPSPEDGIETVTVIWLETVLPAPSPSPTPSVQPGDPLLAAVAAGVAGGCVLVGGAVTAVVVVIIRRRRAAVARRRVVPTPSRSPTPTASDRLMGSVTPGMSATPGPWLPTPSPPAGGATSSAGAPSATPPEPDQPQPQPQPMQRSESTGPPHLISIAPTPRGSPRPGMVQSPSLAALAIAARSRHSTPAPLLGSPDSRSSTPLRPSTPMSMSIIPQPPSTPAEDTAVIQPVAVQGAAGGGVGMAMTPMRPGTHQGVQMQPGGVWVHYPKSSRWDDHHQTERDS
ncbi:putative choice-of-anchor D domain [Paratrimastix pyriformis]|uniref:Choice-of-anchor D domain n=1 Tax=Paratrimastix pyriformis TaxID=342808 RepID=A0ABQ8UFG4_9EUKA|nr:putative choice-of-anchor D domain [Paratrimastix pyriformis]